MEKDIYEELVRLQAEGSVAALATVTATKGSTPRKVGAKMIVRPNGAISGTIGGGCGEAEVWQEAMNVIATRQPKLVTVDLTNDVEGEDKICGGLMYIFVEPVIPDRS